MVLSGWMMLSVAHAAPIPQTTSQLIVATAPDWNASTATLQRYTRSDGEWLPVGEVIEARLGRDGLAWGRGLHPAQDGALKVEGDWRAPAGVFEVGQAFGDAVLEPAPDWPMQTVTERSLWVEDPESPHYNQHLLVDGEQPLTPWQTQQRMRLGDSAHRLKLVVEHNTTTPLSGGGSAIFFHIWRRDGASATAGCTAIPEASMEELIRWLSPQAQPVYVLLPKEEYDRLQNDWNLPPPHLSPD